MNGQPEDHQDDPLEILRFTVGPMTPPGQGEIARCSSFRRAVAALMAKGTQVLDETVNFLRELREIPKRFKGKVQFELTYEPEAGELDLRNSRLRELADEQFAQLQRRLEDCISKEAERFVRCVGRIVEKGGSVTFDKSQLQQILIKACQVVADDSTLPSGGGGQEIETILRSADLPSPDKIALQVTEMARDPETTALDLAMVMERDVALAAKVLKRANCSSSGTVGKIADVKQAGIRLGITSLAGIAAGVSVISGSKRGPCIAFDYIKFWADSSAREACARSFAQRSGPKIAPDEAGTFALLCQVGRLAFATVLPGQYEVVLRLAKAVGPDRLGELEHRLIGIDQNELAAKMLEEWHLPDHLCRATALQDSLTDDEALLPGSNEHTLVSVLHLATRTSGILISGRASQEAVMAVVGQAGKLGIEKNMFGARFDASVDNWHELGSLYEVPTHEVRPWASICAQAGGAH